MADRSKQTVLFPALVCKPTHIRFDEPDATSDGGALLLKAVDQRLGLTRRLATCLADRREPGKIHHSLVDLLRQRIFGICCGYSDTNDTARVGADPMHKLLLDRDPLLGDDLASQPTLSRFENRRRRVDLYRLGEALMAAVIARHGRRLKGRKARLVTIDLDPTDDPVHGQQQLSLFNGYYRCWCYLPMLGFVSFNDEPQQYLVAAMLRPGTCHPKVGTVALLKRLLPTLRQTFPFAVIRVRLDCGFACPEIYEYLEREQVQYLIGKGKNPVLAEMAAGQMEEARTAYAEQDRTVTFYGEGQHIAKSWDRRRRVIYKAEVVKMPGRQPRDNCRFVVTNMAEEPEQIYRIYRQRGDSENRIKELKADLYLDRLSCSQFWANQLRLLLSAAAFVLIQDLQLTLSTLRLKKVQVQTLRLMLLKIGGRIERSVRRIVVHLAASHPWRRQWYLMARALGAVVP